MSEVFMLPFIDAVPKLVKLIGDPFDVIQKALCVIEGFWLAEVGAEVAEGFELACFLLQLRSDFLREEVRDNVLKRYNSTVIVLLKARVCILAANLNGLPVVIHSTVWLTSGTQGFQSTLGEDLEVGPQTLVVFQPGQQAFQVSLPLGLAGLCRGVALGQFT